MSVSGTMRRRITPRAWACSAAPSRSRTSACAVRIGRGPRRSASARLSPSTQLAVRYANVPTTPAAYTWRIAGWSRAASVSVSRRNQARPGESGARCTCKATERFSTRSHAWYTARSGVAATPERAVYHAWDRVLKRSVALHVHLAPDSPGRAWFLRETETLAALDHPAIRHVYAAGVVGTFAYRTANWVEGESVAEALRRGPRPIRTAHALVRDLLGAAEHAHARGVILRRIVPLTLMLELTGRAVITDLRYCNWCLPNVPP